MGRPLDGRTRRGKRRRFSHPVMNVTFEPTRRRQRRIQLYARATLEPIRRMICSGAALCAWSDAYRFAASMTAAIITRSVTRTRRRQFVPAAQSLLKGRSSPSVSWSRAASSAARFSGVQTARVTWVGRRRARRVTTERLHERDRFRVSSRRGVELLVDLSLVVARHESDATRTTSPAPPQTTAARPNTPGSVHPQLMTVAIHRNLHRQSPTGYEDTRLSMGSVVSTGYPTGYVSIYPTG